MNASTMQVSLIERHGDAPRLRTLARPMPRQGEVLVRIAASAVNPLDLKIRAGGAEHARHAMPAVLGIDMAGIVEAVGPRVVGFRPGDEVYGMTGGVGGVQGSLAQYAAVDARLLSLKPASFTMREAASLPLAFITAWEGLVDRAQVRLGQTVLVMGAGGVGNAVIQLARALGATVFAVDDGSRAQQILSWGATPIDRESSVEAYVEEHTFGLGFDIAYDTVGGAGLDTCFRALKRFGHVVSALGWGTHALAPLSFRAASYSGVFTLLPLLTGEGRERHGKILREVAMFADAGRITPLKSSQCLDP